MTDYISSLYALTAKIDQLKEQAASANAANPTLSQSDIDKTLVTLQQSFNDMLNDLMTSSADDEEKTKSDPFAFLTQADQSALTNNIAAQTTASTETSLNINSYTGSLSDPTSSAGLADMLSTPYKLNLDNVF